MSSFATAGEVRVIRRWSITSVVSRTPPLRRELWIAVAMIAYGLFLALYSTWATASDGAAAAVFRTSPDCALRTDERVAMASPTCRVESATVVERRWHATKGEGAAYDLVIRSAAGPVDTMQPLDLSLIRFWRRAVPGERIQLQRFVAPGYHLTGAITALGDKRGWVLTPAHPDAGAHNEGAFVVLGVFLVIWGALLSASWLRRSRRAPALS